MENPKSWWRTWWVILVCVFVYLVMHLFTNTNYGLHRDAYLYLAQSRHLDWGYFSTPPLLAVITRIHTIIWGDSTWAVRLLPTITGSLIMFLAGWLILKLKGGRIAQLTGMAAFLFSPAFLRPASLLQPTVLDHLFWLLAAIVVFIMIRKQRPEYLLLMIPVLGLGWLNKYSIVFYALAILTGLIISRHRRLLRSSHVIWTILGGLILIFPNILWQYNHNWPVFLHMAELQETQLVNVNIGDFLMSQVFMHLPALPVWMAGLIFLVFSKTVKDYRIFALAFILTLLLIILLRGKFYYTIGAYTILIPFGALAWEKWIRGSHAILLFPVMAIIILSGILTMPFSLPVFKPERMIGYDKKLIDRGLGVMLTWEDGKIHELPQDYADMIGWDELGEKVWNFYESLDDSIKYSIIVYGENYGQAGSMLYFRPDKKYPEVFSFNDAFMLWTPRYFYAKHFIYVGYSERLPLYFKKLERVGQVEESHFREYGLPIYFGSYPTRKLYDDWEQQWIMDTGRSSR